MKRLAAAWCCSLVVILGLSGCVSGGTTVFPEETQSQQATQDLSPTATIRVQLTIPAASLTPTAALPSETPQPLTPTQVVTPSPTSVCDLAAAGNPIDVTIPDDSVMTPGQQFTKIWRLENVGDCSWSNDYSARFFYGNQMEAPDLVFLNQNVPPGGIVEIAVDMVAPMQPGTYQGNWKLRNAAGALFGIGPRGDSPFWVRIQVSPGQTATPSTATTQILPATPTATPTPSPTPTSTPDVFVNGAVVLKLNEGVDLDSGKVNELTSDDVVFRVDAGGFHLLFPINGAKLGIIGISEPNPDACRAANVSSAALTLESLPNALYLCFVSNQDRLGWLRYDSLSEDRSQANLFFLTWGE